MNLLHIILKRAGLLGITATIVLGLSACTKNFERYNSDNTGLTDDQLSGDFNNLSYLKSAQRSIYNFSGGGDPNSYQVQQNLNADCFSGYFMSPTVFNGGQNNLNYFMVTGWNGEAFKVGYLNVMAQVAKLRSTGLETNFPAIWAIAQITQVEAMSRVTDIYGPIPYSKAGQSKTDIAYDSQEEIYKRFFLELDSASNNLRSFIASGQKIPVDSTKYDAVYGGNLTQWLHFANSLRLRLAIHILYADAAMAKEQGQKALDPANGGVITTNSDNFQLLTSDAGLTNPLVFISQNWGDIRINAAIQSYMTGYKDPRISRYMNTSTDATVGAVYKGIRIGGVTASNQKSDYQGYSQLSTSTFNINAPVVLMTAAEVYFLRAEAALNGWSNTGGDAKTLYETGITTSMLQWNASSGAYLTDNTSVPAAYTDPKNSANNLPSPSTITIQWNDAASTEEKQERIITQKWIAMFPEGQEAWTEFRRTRYPRLFPVKNNLSGGLINTDIQIRRLPYPQQEYNTNGAQLQNGISLLGGADNGGTRLWWDKKP
ncbi:Susd and RagB outer membrane lipoprotein [Chitinophaga costaii]|uniref:Susd and RagB outer membrane lipoprotein n=1 Tax=Chitinophaga costaii TaxID=1335309 RepID=A0A1C4BKG6_9BACT|nr:RagB/SusD family nutrient uptake outer membrane protein [Chitinophaga costaii]PUZ27572.1 SusD/RagB family nutrient-binding outer membrane lipoprotein [Chitinophaga costaii]SCC07355.1 Susd and RagB outer membrane lipoprotein [Chitinophaga costaii]